MFATLLGGLPRPPLEDGASTDALVKLVIAAQEAAGLEPITDGRLRWPGFAGPMAGLEGLRSVAGDRQGAVELVPGTRPRRRAPLSVDGWRFAAGATTRAVKQALPGPYTLARRLFAASASAGADAASDRTALTMALAAALNEEVRALADAGCPFIEIEERDAGEIGEDDAERRLFRDAHLALTDDLGGVHLSLAIVGGNADLAGIETILAAPYPSLALDLIDGPDNWHLARDVPGDRGVVAGALSPHHPSDDGPELLLWAAGYAASMHGRGAARVGLAIAGDMSALAWDVAERKMTRLGDAVRLAMTPPHEAAEHLDPRAVNLRSAALGRAVPARAPRRKGPRKSG